MMAAGSGEQLAAYALLTSGTIKRAKTRKLQIQLNASHCGLGGLEGLPARCAWGGAATFAF